MITKDTLTGVEDLCRHLNDLGIAATILPEESEERVERGWARSDLGYIKLEDRHVDLIAVRYGGALSPHPSNWSARLNVLSLPLVSRKVVPVQYHFIVRYGGLADRATFKVDLKNSRGGPHWRGGKLTRLLQQDSELASDLVFALDKHEKLWIRADSLHQCIRMVLKTRLVFHFNLVPKPRVVLDRGLPSPELIELIERVARQVRKLV